MIHVCLVGIPVGYGIWPNLMLHVVIKAGLAKSRRAGGRHGDADLPTTWPYAGLATSTLQRTSTEAFLVSMRWCLG